MVIQGVSPGGYIRQVRRKVMGENRRDLFAKAEHIIVRLALLLIMLIGVIKLITFEVVSLLSHFNQ